MTARFGKATALIKENKAVFLMKQNRWTGKTRFNGRILEKLKRGKGETWCVWNDLFHPNVSTGDIEETIISIERAKTETVLVLTKRIKRAFDILEILKVKKLPENMWLGTSIAGTAFIESFYRLKELLAPHTCEGNWFLSIEPMLSRINLTHFRKDLNKLKLVVVGCESGAKRRKIGTSRLDDLIRQCKDYQLPLFIKQWDFSGKKIVKTGELPSEYSSFQQLPF